MIKIIIVESDQDELIKACRIAAEKGVKFFPCETGLEALDILKRRKDVIGLITDLRISLVCREKATTAACFYLVSKALEMGIRAVICSDEPFYPERIIKVLSTIQKEAGEKIKGFIVENKNWKQAIQLLENNNSQGGDPCNVPNAGD